MKKWLIFLAFCILAIPASAQDRTGGAIYLVNPSDNENLNPLLCSDTVCEQLGRLFFPSLLAIDPEKAILTASTGDDRALALDWQTDDGLTYTFTLRDNLQWDDGAPVTAYDVFYSYLAIRSPQVNSPYLPAVNTLVRAMLPRDATHLTVVLKSPRCDVLDVLNFPVLPAHVLDTSFAASAQFDSDSADDFTAWLETSAPDFSGFANLLYNYTLPVTLAGNNVDEIRGGDFIRFKLPGGVGAYVYNRIDTEAAVDYFLNGSLDYIYHPPYSRWNDILASDANAYIYPGYAVEYIEFNLSNPERPRARVKDGVIQKQLPHPILSDVRVRKAIQMGLDVRTLIDASVQGYGTPVAGSQPPGSWALNPDLTPVAYDPEGAKKLLDEAGWKMAVTGGGSRACQGCLYAEPGTVLALRMDVSDTPEHHALIAPLVEQMRAIGIRIDVNFIGQVPLETGDQGFDLALGTMEFNYPANPHRYDAIYMIENDVPGRRLSNSNSYNNPDLALLLKDARTYPGCDYETRTKLYAQVQTILNDDLPYLWLFAPDEMMAVRGWVLNARMYPYQPFWNLDRWAVSYVQGK